MTVSSRKIARLLSKPGVLFSAFNFEFLFYLISIVSYLLFLLALDSFIWYHFFHF